MTAQEQQIAIAEACGVKIDGWWCDYCKEFVPPNFVTFTEQHTFCLNPVGQRPLPDYLHDLNAMHEAEKVILNVPETIQGDAMRKRYRIELETVTSKKKWGDRIWHATAPQRAEAFLRTIGKWEDYPRDSADHLIAYLLFLPLFAITFVG